MTDPSLLQPSFPEVAACFRTDAPQNSVRVNGVQTKIGSFDILNVRGDIWSYGYVRSALHLGAGIDMAPGTTLEAPNIVVTNGFTAQSVNIVTGQITSPTNLYLNPSGAYIDCGGKILTNYAGGPTPVNANRYEVASPGTVTTMDATPTTVFSIATVDNAAYALTTDIVVACPTNGKSGSFSVLCKAKNYGSVVTVSDSIQNGWALDTGIETCTAEHVAGAGVVDVRVTGVIGTTLRWYGATKVTRQLIV